MRDSDLNKKIMQRLKVGGILCLPLLFYIVVALLVRMKGISICLWRLAFHQQCWGCGMTRAFNALFHGHLSQAYDFNPRVFIVAIIFLYLWISMLVKAFRSGKRC